MERRPRRPDPFRAPDHEAPGLELVDSPPVRTAVDVPPPAPMAAPERRQAVQYKRPRTSWVTFVVLGFAAVGMAAVGGTAIKKLLSQGRGPAPQAAAPRPVTYSSVSKDDAVLVKVAVSPRDARLLLDGEPAVSNPLRLLRGNTRHKVTAHAHGYAPLEQEFTADASKTITLRLTKN
jgi:hypothetical protein